MKLTKNQIRVLIKETFYGTKAGLVDMEKEPYGYLKDHPDQKIKDLAGYDDPDIRKQAASLASMMSDEYQGLQDADELVRKNIDPSKSKKGKQVSGLKDISQARKVVNFINRNLKSKIEDVARERALDNNRFLDWNADDIINDVKLLQSPGGAFAMPDTVIPSEIFIGNITGEILHGPSDSIEERGLIPSLTRLLNKFLDNEAKQGYFMIYQAVEDIVSNYLLYDNGLWNSFFKDQDEKVKKAMEESGMMAGF